MSKIDDMHADLKHATDEDGYYVTQIAYNELKESKEAFKQSLSLHMKCLSGIIRASNILIDGVEHGRYSDDDFVAIKSSVWREFVGAYAEYIDLLAKG